MYVLDVRKLEVDVSARVADIRARYRYVEEDRALAMALREYIVKKQTIKGIEIEPPEIEFSCRLNDFWREGEQYEEKCGIYFLYGKDGALLNIGSTCDLYRRIITKSVGNDWGSDADYYFWEYYDRVSISMVYCFQAQRLLEAYLINKLQPPLNYHYNYYDKAEYKRILDEKRKAAPRPTGFFG